jgi:hypothetical protein
MEEKMQEVLAFVKMMKKRGISMMAKSCTPEMRLIKRDLL